MSLDIFYSRRTLLLKLLVITYAQPHSESCSPRRTQCGKLAWSPEWAEPGVASHDGVHGGNLLDRPLIRPIPMLGQGHTDSQLLPKNT
jgi:hypothetical protein